MLNRSGIIKTKGASPLELFTIVFSLAFIGKNFFEGVVRNKKVTVGKDAVYNFLNSSTYNWIGYEDKFHEILLVRSIHTLMDQRCSLTIREEITEWLNAPLIPEDKLEDPKYLDFLPFSYQACCIFAAVNPIELIKNLSFSLRMNHFPYDFYLLD